MRGVDNAYHRPKPGVVDWVTCHQVYRATPPYFPPTCLITAPHILAMTEFIRPFRVLDYLCIETHLKGQGKSCPIMCLLSTAQMSYRPISSRFQFIVRRLLHPCMYMASQEEDPDGQPVRGLEEEEQVGVGGQSPPVGIQRLREGECK